MLTVPIISCVEEIVASRGVNANGQASTIRCYSYPVITTSPRPATHALAAKSGYPPAPTLGAP